MSDEKDDFDLSAYDAAFAEAKVLDTEQVPHGKYHVAVHKVGVEPNNKNELQWKWTLKVLGPTHVGRFIWKDQNITEKGMMFLKTDLHTCGFNVDKITLTEAQKRRGELIGVKLEIEKKPQAKNPKYSDVYFNKRLSEETPSGGDSGGAAEAGPGDVADAELGF
jgi:hypothetical protein